MDLTSFFSSEASNQVKHPMPVRDLLHALEGSPAMYDLLFYAAFSHRTFTVMRREGKDAPGFTRMQQSFSEAVHKVRDAIAEAGRNGYTRASSYTAMSQEGMAALMTLIEDLSVVKEWQVKHGEVRGDASSEASGDATARRQDS